MKASRFWPVCVCALLLAPGGAHGQHFPPAPELRALIQDRVDGSRAVGIVLGVMEADGSTTVVAAGSAGPDARPLGERTLFEIGSITKTFTAALLADLDDADVLDLEDPVAAHLPEGVRVPYRNGPIRLVDLSTHHSGLPRMPSNFDPADPSNPYADYTEELLYAFLAEHELRRDVGAAFEYSNVGVGLLGHALAHTGGGGYEDVLRTRILEPLGLRSAGIELDDEGRAWLAQGHDVHGRVVPHWDVGVLAGAGGLRADIRDMLRYLDANLGPPESRLEEVLRRTHVEREAIGPNASIGLGWHLLSAGGARLIGHGGGTAGFRTFMAFDPDLRVGAVILTNSARSADDIALHLVNPRIPLAEPSWTSAVVAGVGVLTLLFGLLGIVRPAALLAIAERSSLTRWWFFGGTLARAAVGVVFLLAAPTARYPMGLWVLGLLSLVAAAAMPIVGFARVRRFVEWWADRPPRVIRLVSIGPALVGALVVWWAG